MATFSVEIELGWSLSQSGKLENLSEDRQTETAALDHLLSLCDQYDIPFTFDIVSHLLLEACEGVHNSPHADDRFAVDPGTDRSQDPAFYAPDLARAIADARVDHELASHTFSHALFDVTTSGVAAWELERAQEQHREWGSPFVSLVTPRHHHCDPAVLRDAGVRIVRMPAETVSHGSTSRIKNLIRLLRGAPLVEPAVKSGIVHTYSSRYPSLASPLLPSGHDSLPLAFSLVPRPLRERFHRRQLLRTVDAVVDEQSHAHLWCHLFDLSPPCQRQPLADFFERLARYRDEGRLTIKTMRELNDAVRTQERDTKNN